MRRAGLCVTLVALVFPWGTAAAQEVFGQNIPCQVTYVGPDEGETITVRGGTLITVITRIEQHRDRTVRKVTTLKYGSKLGSGQHTFHVDRVMRGETGGYHHETESPTERVEDGKIFRLAGIPVNFVLRGNQLQVLQHPVDGPC